MADQSGEIRALGLDLGANSIGWALLAESDDKPSRVIATGVRVFEAGVEGDIESGKDESRNTKRRDARLIRRQAERRARRRVRLVVRSIIADHEHEPRRAARSHESSPTRLPGLDTVRV